MRCRAGRVQPIVSATPTLPFCRSPPCAHRFPISGRVDSRIGLHLNNQKGVIPSNDNSCEGPPSRFPCLMIFVCQLAGSGQGGKVFPLSPSLSLFPLSHSVCVSLSPAPPLSVSVSLFPSLALFPLCGVLSVGRLGMPN